MAATPIPNITIDHSTASRAVKETNRHVKSATSKPVKPIKPGKPSFNQSTSISTAPNKINEIDDQLRYLLFDELREQRERQREQNQRAILEAELRRRDVMNLPHEAPLMSADHARLTRLYAQRSARNHASHHSFSNRSGNQSVNPVCSTHIRSSSSKKPSTARAPLTRSSSNKPHHDVLRLHADAVINEATGRFAHQPDPFAPSRSSSSKPGWKSWRRGPGSSSSSDEIHLNVAAIDAASEAPRVNANQPMVVTIKPTQWKDYQIGDQSIGKARVRPRIVQDTATFRAERKKRISTKHIPRQPQRDVFDDEMDSELLHQQLIHNQIQQMNYQDQPVYMAPSPSISHPALDDPFYTSQFVRPTASGTRRSSSLKQTSIRPEHLDQHNQSYLSRSDSGIDEPVSRYSPSNDDIVRNIAQYRRRLLDDLAHIDNLRQIHLAKGASFHPRSHHQWTRELDKRSADTQRKLDEIDQMSKQSSYSNNFMSERDPAFVTSTATVRAEPVRRQLYSDDRPANRAIKFTPDNQRNKQSANQSIQLPTRVHEPSPRDSLQIRITPSEPRNHSYSHNSIRSPHNQEILHDIDQMMSLLSQRATQVAQARMSNDHHVENNLSQPDSYPSHVDDIVSRYSAHRSTQSFDSFDVDLEPRSDVPHPVDRSQVSWAQRSEHQAQHIERATNQTTRTSSVTVVDVLEDDSDFDSVDMNDADVLAASVALKEEDLE